MVRILMLPISVRQKPKSTLTDNPSAFEGTTINQSFAKHIHTIHSAKQPSLTLNLVKKYEGLYKQNLKLSLYVFSKEIKFFTREMIQTAGGPRSCHRARLENCTYSPWYYLHSSFNMQNCKI